MSFLKAPALAIPDFRALFLTRFSASMALNVQAVIVGWQVYKLQPDPLLLGLIGLTEAIPAIGCAFFSGHIVDTHRPVRVYRWSLLALLFNTILLWTAVWEHTPFDDFQRLVLLFTGVFISGAARSFGTPSVYSLVPRVVPRSLLGAAAAWNSSSYQFASIVGPVVGGLAFGFLGAEFTFAIPVILVAIAMSMTLALSPNIRSFKSDHEREPFLKSIKAGIDFAFGHKVLLSTMTLDMFSVLFGGAVAVLPVFADQVFHTGSQGLGVLRAAPAIGSVLVGVWLAMKPMRVISGRTLLLVVAGFGLATIGFAISGHFVIALVFLAFSGVFDGISMVIRSTLLQILAPEHMRGRIAALSSVFITSSNEIGAFESGVAARFLGLIPSVLFGGTMTLVVVATTWLKVPALARTRIDQNT
ncbi:MAG: MFS transporter [Bdellovibrionota bacterium]